MPNVVLRAPTMLTLNAAARWRQGADVLPGLRSERRLTPDDQDEFFEGLRQPGSPHRYYDLVSIPGSAADSRVVDGPVIGLGGLTNLDWPNGWAEISLILDPMARGRGFGRAAVAALLAEGFDRLRLFTIVAECYDCNPAADFWQRVLGHVTRVRLPRRKWHAGKLWDATLYVVTVDDWKEWPTQ